MSAVATPMTTDEFLSLPDDDKFDRWLIDGRMRERAFLPFVPHSRTMALLAAKLEGWSRTSSEQAFGVYAGGCTFRLTTDPDSVLGLDLAVVNGRLEAEPCADDRFFDGAPLLAVEILSDIDVMDDILERVRACHRSGTPVAWVVDPVMRTVTIHRPNAHLIHLSETQYLTGHPELPGFSVSVADLFG